MQPIPNKSLANDGKTINSCQMQPIQWKSTKYAQILTNPVFYTQKVLFSMHCMQLVAKYALLVKLKPILCKSLQKLENV